MGVVAMNMHVQADERNTVPAALQDYLDLDLRPEGGIGKDLIGRADSEPALESIRLSELVGTQPANITPEMADWYQLYIEAPRSMALHAVSLLFKERCDPAKGEGFLAQTRLGSLEEGLLKRKLQVYQDH